MLFAAIAEIPGVSELIEQLKGITEQARAQGGWTAGVVVVTMVVFVIGIAVIIRYLLQDHARREDRSAAESAERWRQATERETRLIERLTIMEDFQRNDLVDLNVAATRALGEMTSAISTLTTSLREKPCLMHINVSNANKEQQQA